MNNASLSQLKSDKIKKGDGIFVLNQKELDNLNLSKSERELIKPYFTSEELTKYSTVKENSKWIIYTNSQFKNTKSIEKYPNIKKHLDKFKDIITSDNKPYGLHRAREQRFFTDEKIMSLRKCKEPTFTLTEGECYVSQSYFIIKTKRVSLKYLTAFLNSNIIKFWLLFKGKMQGQNYQIDKVPLLNIPICISEFESEIIEMFNDIENNTHKVNKLLYKTYGFTTEEVDLLEKHLLK
ncbi:TaqI-like C-terminal specificity domain-containing protein [Capnocytophaga canimorsus]|uniref:TaqI-like C-terminal specificity domain-containing protein n=1 Tax=Capnocytophaga canimorsus TaxID=28188 RepID=UPI00385E8BAC